MSRLSAGILLLLILLIGCGTVDDTTDNTDEPIHIVATTTMITDLLEVIGEDQVNVEGLMGPGIDPHGYQASASDVDKMFEVGIVAYNGMDLEGQMGEVFSQLDNSDKEVFVMEEAVGQEDILESDDADLAIDPHIWFSVPLGSSTADYITDSLSEYDPENASMYAENNDDYQEKLQQLDTYIRE